ncbi:unnamed protein product [Mycena citricolor]|uniref:RING-type domain-containing protein n=1 Tax=Mycena citricolor TaxID=2018698 RepID=A0AAD2H6M5_9AGAR|nr:unnamed protein product [Mycena citricolor]
MVESSLANWDGSQNHSHTPAMARSIGAHTVRHPRSDHISQPIQHKPNPTPNASASPSKIVGGWVGTETAAEETESRRDARTSGAPRLANADWYARFHTGEIESSALLGISRRFQAPGHPLNNAMATTIHHLVSSDADQPLATSTRPSSASRDAHVQGRPSSKIQSDAFCNTSPDAASSLSSSPKSPPYAPPFSTRELFSAHIPEPISSAFGAPGPALTMTDVAPSIFSASQGAGVQGALAQAVASDGSLFSSLMRSEEEEEEDLLTRGVQGKAKPQDDVFLAAPRHEVGIEPKSTLFTRSSSHSTSSRSRSRSRSSPASFTITNPRDLFSPGPETAIPAPPRIRRTIAPGVGKAHKIRKERHPADTLDRTTPRLNELRGRQRTRTRLVMDYVLVPSAPYLLHKRRKAKPRVKRFEITSEDSSVEEYAVDALSSSYMANAMSHTPYSALSAKVKGKRPMRESVGRPLKRARKDGVSRTKLTWTSLLDEEEEEEEEDTPKIYLEFDMDTRDADRASYRALALNRERYGIPAGYDDAAQRAWRRRTCCFEPRSRTVKENLCKDEQDEESLLTCGASILEGDRLLLVSHEKKTRGRPLMKRFAVELDRSHPRGVSTKVKLDESPGEKSALMTETEFAVETTVEGSILDDIAIEPPPPPAHTDGDIDSHDDPLESQGDVFEPQVDAIYDGFKPYDGDLEPVKDGPITPHIEPFEPHSNAVEPPSAIPVPFDPQPSVPSSDAKPHSLPGFKDELVGQESFYPQLPTWSSVLEPDPSSMSMEEQERPASYDCLSFQSPLSEKALGKQREREQSPQILEQEDFMSMFVNMDSAEESSPKAQATSLLQNPTPLVLMHTSAARAFMELDELPRFPAPREDVWNGTIDPAVLLGDDLPCPPEELASTSPRKRKRRVLADMVAIDELDFAPNAAPKRVSTKRQGQKPGPKPRPKPKVAVSSARDTSPAQELSADPFFRYTGPPWPAGDDPDEDFCHHCRRKTGNATMKFTDCAHAFCVRCVIVKYDPGTVPFALTRSTDDCPRCQDTCRCDICTKRRGDVYVHKRPTARTAQHTPLDEITLRAPQAYYATMYGVNGAPLARTFLGANGDSSVVRAKPLERRLQRRVFVGRVQEHWALGDPIVYAEPTPVRAGLGAGAFDESSDDDDEDESDREGPKDDVQEKRLYIGDESVLRLPPAVLIQDFKPVAEDNYWYRDSSMSETPASAVEEEGIIMSGTGLTPTQLEQVITCALGYARKSHPGRDDQQCDGRTEDHDRDTLKEAEPSQPVSEPAPAEIPTDVSSLLVKLDHDH